MGVSDEEFFRALKKMISRNAAPGPDGLPGKVLALAVRVLGGRIRTLFTECLKKGRFPDSWKQANLVLLSKEGRSQDSPVAFQPICLLDELGKLYERVLVGRIQNHLEETGPDLHERQFGFRHGRSTIDAVLHVRSFVKEEVAQGNVVFAVSLDIVNAFNTLPWDRIGEALEMHGIPRYLRAVLRDYFRPSVVIQKPPRRRGGKRG